MPKYTSRRTAPAILPLLLALLICLAGTAGGATLRGIPINAGDTLYSAITPAGDQDTFVFDAYAGTSLTLTLSPAKKSLLRPTVEIRDPSGAVIDIESHLKRKKSKITVKKLPLAKTGRYAIVVSGGSSEGSYQLKTKATPPKRTKLGLRLEGSHDVLLPGKVDVFTTVTIKDTDGLGFEVLSVLDPEGVPVPGAKESFVFKKGNAKGTIALNGTLGDYVLRLGDKGAPTTVRITIKGKYPKVKGRKIRISPLEPVVTVLDPEFGRDGDTVDITGENFAAGGLEVLFGDTPSDYATWKTPTLVRARVPAGEGAVAVTVYNPDGQSGTSPGLFTYIAAPPAVTSSIPSMGPDTGGTLVDVFGKDFGAIVEVTLGGAVVSSAPQMIDEGHLRFTTDAHAAGSATLVLTDKWGQSDSMTGAFDFYGEPAIGEISPAGGSENGGTLVTVTGAWLHEEDRVFLDGVRIAPVTCVGRTELRFTTPSHPAGKVDLRIEDPWGRSTTLEDAFEFTTSSFTDNTDTGMPKNVPGLIYGGRALAIGDLDGDKDQDIVLGRTVGASPRAFILTNDGKGVFKDGRLLPPPPGNGDDWDASSVALGDLDGDGDLDIVMTCPKKIQGSGSTSYFVGKVPHIAHNPLYPSTRVIINNGKLGLALKKDALPLPKNAGTDLFQADSVAVGDVDGDNDLDLVLTLSKGPGESIYTTSIQASNVHRYFTVVYNNSRPSTRVLLNDGKGVFSDSTSRDIPKVSDGDMFAGDRVLLGDMDGDTDLDIILTGNGKNLKSKSAPEFVSGSKTRILQNQSGTFKNVTSTFMPATKGGDEWCGVGLAMGDLDGDKLADDLAITLDQALAGKVFMPSTRLFTGSSKGFKEVTSSWMPGVDANGNGDLWKGVDVRLVDPDGDGYADVFIAHTEKVLVKNPDTGFYDRQISSLRWLKNNGEGDLENVTEKRLPSPATRKDYLLGHTVELGDLDGDDDLDLVLTTELAEYLKSGMRPTRILELK